MKFVRWAFGKTWFDDPEDVLIFTFFGVVAILGVVGLLTLLAALVLSGTVGLLVATGIVAVLLGGAGVGRLMREASARGAHKQYPYLADTKWRKSMGGTPPWEQR